MNTLGVLAVGAVVLGLASATQAASTVRITDSLTEVISEGSSIRIFNPRRPAAGPRRPQPDFQIRSVSPQGGDYRLTVETSGRSLNADLILDGETIKALTRSSETIDLSSYLSTPGSHTLEIVGSYSPATATVSLSFSGPGTQLSQQVSGSGTLRQTMQVAVR